MIDYAGGNYFWVKFKGSASTKLYNLSYKLLLSVDPGVLPYVDEVIITQMILNNKA